MKRDYPRYNSVFDKLNIYFQILEDRRDRLWYYHGPLEGQDDRIYAYFADWPPVLSFPPGDHSAVVQVWP